MTPTDGRTHWWACDAAWYDRERVADLALMYGPAGVAALHWLCCHAKLLNDGGRIKTGFSAVTKGIGGKVAEVTDAVRYAAEIGALDDFEESDGKRFTARVSGWEADQDKALAAIRQARWRERNAPSRSVTLSNAYRDRDREVKDGANAPSPEVDPEIIGLCDEMARLILVADPKAQPGPGTVGWQRDMRLLVERDKRTPSEVRAVLAYIFDEGFWIPLVRSPAALRKRFEQIAAQQARPVRRGPTGPKPKTADEGAQIMAEYEARMAARKTAESPASNPDEEAL